MKGRAVATEAPKACTDSNIPLLVTRVANITKSDALRIENSLIRVLFPLDNDAVWKNAVSISHGSSDAVSTGSHDQ